MAVSQLNKPQSHETSTKKTQTANGITTRLSHGLQTAKQILKSATHLPQRPLTPVHWHVLPVLLRLAQIAFDGGVNEVADTCRGRSLLHRLPVPRMRLRVKRGSTVLGVKVGSPARNHRLRRHVTHAVLPWPHLVGRRHQQRRRRERRRLAGVPRRVRLPVVDVRRRRRRRRVRRRLTRAGRGTGGALVCRTARSLVGTQGGAAVVVGVATETDLGDTQRLVTESRKAESVGLLLGGHR